MKNKKAKQSALDVYRYLFLRCETNTKKYIWTFDRMENAECGWGRSDEFMRHKEFDVVSVMACDL